MSDLLSPPMSITLPRLTREELLALIAYSESKQSVFGVFATWLREISETELDRRSDDLREPEMLRLPNWRPSDLSDALAGAFCLSHQALSPSLTIFADELLKHVVCDSVAVLGFLDPFWTAEET